jgi:hypothetical protein
MLMKQSKITPGSILMWESSRMMMTHHVEALNLQKKESCRKERPEFDAQRIDEFLNE